MEFAKKKYKISFLGGPTTPTYSILDQDKKQAIFNASALWA